MVVLVEIIIAYAPGIDNRRGFGYNKSDKGSHIGGSPDGSFNKKVTAGLRRHGGYFFAFSIETISVPNRSIKYNDSKTVISPTSFPWPVASGKINVEVGRTALLTSLAGIIIAHATGIDNRRGIHASIHEYIRE